MSSSNAAQLRASLEKHNATFEALLKLIPAKFYIATPDEEKASKYEKNKKNKAPKQLVKEASKKARRDKLDPENQKSIVDLQEEAALKQAEQSANAKGKQKLISNEPEPDEDANEEEMDVDVVGGAEEEGPLKPMPESGSIGVLRAKLHARIAELRQKGKEQKPEAGNKDELLEERRHQRATKKQERKEAKRKEREKAQKEELQRKKGSQTKNQLLVPDTPRAEAQNPASSVTTVAFSKVNTSSHLAKKFKTSSNPQQALVQVASRGKKIAELPDEKREVVQEREKWEKAQARMEGIKVHDDESKLKKIIKKKEKEKAKSKKNWEERKDQITAAMAAKQKKRTDNIAMRNERKGDKRKGIKPKPSKGRPGFEGKSFGKGKPTSKTKK